MRISNYDDLALDETSVYSFSYAQGNHKNGVERIEELEDGEDTDKLSFEHGIAVAHIYYGICG